MLAVELLASLVTLALVVGSLPSGAVDIIECVVEIILSVVLRVVVEMLLSVDTFGLVVVDTIPSVVLVSVVLGMVVEMLLSVVTMGLVVDTI